MFFMIFTTFFAITFWINFEWVLASITTQFWKALGIILNTFSWRIFQWISDCIFYRFWMKIDSQRRCQEGQKTWSPDVGFYFAASLATLALKGLLWNLIFATRALKRVLWKFILDVVSRTFSSNFNALRHMPPTRFWALRGMKSGEVMTCWKGAPANTLYLAGS